MPRRKGWVNTLPASYAKMVTSLNVAQTVAGVECQAEAKKNPPTSTRRGDKGNGETHFHSEKPCKKCGDTKNMSPLPNA